MPQSPRLLRPSGTFTPRSISGLALWLDAADTQSLYTTDAGPVTAVSAPTEISGCALWLDADDLNSMTLSDSNVSEWRDKSGAGSPAASQAVSASRPQRVASSLNGRATIEFDNTDSLVFGSSTAAFNYLHNATGATMFVVLKPATTSNPDSIRYLFNNTNNASGNTGVSIFMDDRSSLTRNNSLQFYVTRGVSGLGTSSIGQNDFFTAVNSFCIMSVVMDNANATAASRLLARQNGVLSGATNTAANAAAATNASFDLTIGNFGGGGAPAAIAEIIFYQGVISTSDRARVEAYLAAKWGISGVHAQATATSDPVGCWRDKSGNNRHATQATAGNRPTISATALNGKKQLGLISQHLRGPSTTWTGSASIYWVGKTGQAAFGAFVFGDGTTDQTDGFHAGWLNTAGVGAYGNGWQSGNAPRAESPSAWRNADIVAGVTLSSTEAIARVNGATTNTTAALTGTLAQSAAAQFYIGRESSGTWTNLNGTLAELLIYQPALNASQRQRIERYLAAKWGIALAPQVSNADAQDWVNRVYANGGTVSSTTATAVNTFCNNIDAAGLRDRFYRLNLFCGTGLSACLVPLYRGPSLGGTQYGGTTDTNNGPFVSGDYAETGASGGLTGNGTSKYLDTGLTYDAMGVPSTNHIGVFKGAGTWNTNIEIIGARDADDYYYIQGRAQVGGDHKVHAFSGPAASAGSFINNATVSSATNFLVASRNSSASFVLYQNAASVASTSSAVTIAGSNRPFLVFMRDIGTGPSFGGWAYRLLGYSFGLGMSAAQVSAYNSAMQALQTSLGRNV